MALSPLYITDNSLQQYFVDKDTGLPLAGGLVYFYSDNNRNQLKNVYELTGSPPNYTYTPLQNPLTLSGVGTFQNPDTGDDIAVYYKPYDDFGNVENYYIAVYAAAEPPPGGSPQFTREAWPNVVGSNDPTVESQNGYENMVSNSQFVEVLFNPDYTLTLTYSGNSVTTYSIAPDWDLVIEHTSGGSLTVLRTARLGNAAIPTNPPYTLTFTPGGNISGLYLRQRLPHNPGIWSKVSPAGAGLGYIASTVLVGPNTDTVRMYYAPSVSATGPQLILEGTNNPGANWAVLKDTRQLIVSDNTQNSNTGYVDIRVNLPTSSASSISSVQVVGLDAEVDDVSFEQMPVNRQQDFLSHYYKPQLAYKPIPSHLVGWDFALNPAQLNGASVAAQAVGAGKSYYAWDQTILFQSANSGLTVSRASEGGLKVLAAVTGQFAMIQYLDAVKAKQILSNKIAVNIEANCNLPAGVVGCVSLWYTSDASLPDLTAGTNNSIVLTLDANGKPATRNGTWTEVARSNRGDGLFTITENTSDIYSNYSLSGWDITTNADIATAKFFAIVVGFAELDNPEYITFGSIGLCSGDIATRPAPQTQDEVLRECERYYEKSLASATLASGANTLVNAITAPMQYKLDANPSAATTATAVPQNFGIVFKSEKRAAPSIKLYSPITATVDRVNAAVLVNNVSGGNSDENITSWTQTGLGVKSVYYLANNTTLTANSAYTAYQPVSVYINYHYIADARLGIV